MRVRRIHGVPGGLASVIVTKPGASSSAVAKGSSPRPLEWIFTFGRWLGPKGRHTSLMRKDPAVEHNESEPSLPAKARMPAALLVRADEGTQPVGGQGHAPLGVGLFHLVQDRVGYAPLVFGQCGRRTGSCVGAPARAVRRQ